MSRSRPGSRPVSRANSFSEAGVHIPVDARLGGHHDPHHERSDGRPVQMYGPGFSSAPVHSAESQVKYVLVTAEMLQSIEAGRAPTTTLVQPPGTQLAPSQSRAHLPTQEISQIPTLEKGHNSAVSDFDDKHSSGELVETAPVADEPTVFLANPIARLRYRYREYFGEFIGTMVLIIFGNGVNCQVVLSKLTQGSYLSISHGWGAGVMFGVYIAGGISGAHLSPAVTTALAVYRGFPWRKVPGYCLAQLLGAMTGSIFIQANYKNLIDQFEGGPMVRTFGLETSTATLFFTGAQPYLTNVSAFFSEFGATAVLLAVILCLGDANNNPCPPGMNGLILFFLILAIGAALGTQTAYCLNPARDLGPRIAASMFGYPKEIWTYRNGYWFWCVTVATIAGACAGCFVYDLFIYQGADSPLNKPFELPWSKKHHEKKAVEAGQA